MRPSYVLYGLGIAFFAAGYLQEVRELKEQQKVWVKATASDINGSSSSRSSPRQQPSQPTASD